MATPPVDSSCPEDQFGCFLADDRTYLRRRESPAEIGLNVDRGAVAGGNAHDQPGLCDSYCGRLDSWERVDTELLRQIVADAGSISEGAKVLDVRRSTLSAWLRAMAKRDG